MFSEFIRRCVLLRVAVVVPSLFVSAATAGEIETFDDISFWVGEGENRAALAIDWHGHLATDQSLVWGYRWDGAATSIDMFDALLAADNRLYAKAGTFGNGTAVYGIGYDANADGVFELDDGTQWDAIGFAKSGPADLALPMHAEDIYQEGWFLGYWHHALGAGETPTWSSGSGLSNRTLADGDWDSLAYKNTTDAILASPSRLMAAENTMIAGDFDRSGIVDASDFTVWRDSLAQAALMHGYGADGNSDGVIGLDDYDVWMTAFQNQSASSGKLVPEPNATGILAWIALVLIFLKRKSS